MVGCLRSAARNKTPPKNNHDQSVDHVLPARYCCLSTNPYTSLVVRIYYFVVLFTFVRGSDSWSKTKHSFVAFAIFSFCVTHFLLWTQQRHDRWCGFATDTEHDWCLWPNWYRFNNTTDKEWNTSLFWSVQIHRFEMQPVGVAFLFRFSTLSPHSHSLRLCSMGGRSTKNKTKSTDRLSHYILFSFALLSLSLCAFSLYFCRIFGESTIPSDCSNLFHSQQQPHHTKAISAIAILLLAALFPYLSRCARSTKQSVATKQPSPTCTLLLLLLLLFSPVLSPSLDVCLL
jgi:hypothetical protein